MTTKSFNVGIIGYGLSAKTFHIPFINYLSEFTLYAVVQRSPKPGDDASKDWPDAKIYRSVEELVADANVDVVVVGTAPVMHFEMAKRALENEKHGNLEFWLDLRC
jgi:predicted dehydrogenase